MDELITLPQYGTGDATYQATGGLEGITRLVNRFYDNMDALPEAKTLRAMHPKDLTGSRQKLVYFLSGWMGGPKLFAEHFGSISLPVAHRHFPIDQASMQSWLDCMALSLQQEHFPEPLRDYLMQKFATPAESIRLLSEYTRNNPA